tara:strand:- start:817 stop:1245 length:429 start_codon:yes stop_codon:yes gene_type:complete
MSWATCYSGSNNIHFNSPPMMSDGRNFTTWVPACTINETIQKKNNLTTNYDYRQYLIANAKELMEYNSTSACDQCTSCLGQSNDIKTANKYIFTSTSDTDMPYGYEKSDLKNLYLSRRALQSKQIAPILTQEQYFRRRTLGQ